MKYDIIFSADASRKEELIKLIRKYRFGLSALQIAATENTALYINLFTGLRIKSLAEGCMGGYLQIAQLAEQHDAAMIILLFDPALMRLDSPGILTLLKSCYLKNIPLANNCATAEFILERYLDRQMVFQNRVWEMAPAHGQAA